MLRSHAVSTSSSLTASHRAPPFPPTSTMTNEETRRSHPPTGRGVRSVPREQFDSSRPSKGYVGVGGRGGGKGDKGLRVQGEGRLRDIRGGVQEKLRVMCFSTSIAFRVTCMLVIVPQLCPTRTPSLHRAVLIRDMLRVQTCLSFLFLQQHSSLFVAKCMLLYVCYPMYAAQAPIGPKQTHVVQTQRYSLHGPDWHVLPPAGPDGRSSAPIQAVVLDHSSQMLDIPYSTYFTVEETWAATQHPTKPKCCTLVMGLEVCLYVCVLCIEWGSMSVFECLLRCSDERWL